MASRRQKELRDFYKELKSKPCIDCVSEGKDGIWPAECMDFDHRPGEQKIDAVSKLLKTDRETVLAEVSKCDLICANHHRIRTKERGLSEATKAAISAGMKKWLETPEGKASIAPKMAKASKTRWRSSSRSVGVR